MTTCLACANNGANNKKATNSFRFIYILGLGVSVRKGTTFWPFPYL